MDEATTLDALPAGRIDKLYLHWTGADDASAFGSYHYCIVRRGGTLLVVQSNDPKKNMRDLRVDSNAPYTAHTFGRNSYALGLAIAGMQDATPSDFGPYPLCDDAVDLLCRAVAKLAAHFGVPIDAEHVMTHAEAALLDGYFGEDPVEERWDLARLRPDPHPLTPADAATAGNVLRDRARIFTR